MSTIFTQKQLKKYPIFLLLLPMIVMPMMYGQSPILQDKNAISKAELPNSFVDKNLEDKDKLEEQLSKQTDKTSFHLFSHGQSAQLFINNEWLKDDDLVTFLQPLIQNKKHLNIYGCHFAQGEKGRAAVAYLETALDISIAASDDITGKDGDWNLEVGHASNSISIPNYMNNLQSPPWALSPNPSGGPDIILHRGIAPVTCGVLQSTPTNERWTFGMISLNDAIPTSGRSETTNMDSVFHHDSWRISQIGNVFGIDINETTGATYLTASSNYASGFAEEISILQYGSIGGSNQTTAAGAVYEINPVTGQATLFASLPQQSTTAIHVDCIFGEMVSRSNTGVGLGNIVWDEYRNQYFVTNIEDGRIYRIDQNGTILDSYDPFTYDDGVAGISIINELPYGVVIEPGGNRLLFGGVDTHSPYDYSAVTSPGIYSIDLNSDGSFAGIVDNSYLPSGANYDNYIGTETLHVQITANSGSVTGFISDLEFDPNANLLVGLRVGCYESWFTSDGHGSTTSQIALNGTTNLYTDNIITFDISVQGIYAPEDNYGGVSSYTLEDGSIIYAASSSDILSEAGPHGIAVWNATTANSPLDPLGAFSYGFPLSIDPKGIGGDVDVYGPAINNCPLSCTITNTIGISCATATDGSIISIATSTNSNITNIEYSIDAGTTWQNTGTFSGLTEGDYIIMVRDAVQNEVCTSTCEATVGCENEMTSNTTLTISSGNANNDSTGGDDPQHLSGPIDYPNTATNGNSTNGNVTLLNIGNHTAVLKFDETLPAGLEVIISIAKNNNNGAATISDGNAAGNITFNSGTQDQLQYIPFTLSQATNEITVRRTGGSLWLDGAFHPGFDVISPVTTCVACPSCTITTEGLANVICAGIDAISFDLTVAGTAVGTTYNVSLSGGAATSISPTTGTYDSETTFTLNDNSVGGGDVTITITDASDPNCTRDILVTDPGGVTVVTNPTVESCALNDGSIEIIITGGVSPFNISWDDSNGNSGNSSNQSSPYLINDLPAGTYGITIEDNINCSVNAFETVAASSNCCASITNPSSAQITCEGTPISNLQVDTDAIFPLNFVYFTTAQTGTSMYSGGVSLGLAVPNNGMVSLTDVDFPSAGTYFVYAIQNPTPANSACRPFQEMQVIVYSCPDCTLNIVPQQPIYNDNGTPTNLSDDTFTVNIQVFGSGLLGWTDGQEDRNYGNIITYGPFPIGGNGVNLSFQDRIDTSCQTSFVVNMNSCTYLETCTCCED